MDEFVYECGRDHQHCPGGSVMPDQASPQYAVLQETLFGDVCDVGRFLFVGRFFVVLQKLNNGISKLVPGLQQWQVR
jgi:hypothetical protein